VITYINPAISVLFGATLLDVRLTAAILAGFLLILVGSWLSTGTPPADMMEQATGSRCWNERTHGTKSLLYKE
jgi:hypothetical protein